ncbi:MAG TPA: hypothetical protein VHY58_18080 [Streptosporangiaceae bacterium]|jgi:hypothetical protein|nr:hypothetical protein [Streptosporangiaceae bacterium]
MSIPDVNAAEQFLAAHGRVLDWRRFDRLFRDGAAEPVRDAVAAYRNADGGFGHALEPDGRAPASQGAAMEQALRILHEADAWDAGLVAGACDWLQAIAPAEGGAAFVEPSIEGWPHAPWWVPEDGRPAALLPTGMIAGTLHARGVRHPWLDRATELMWARIEDLADVGPYDLRGVLRFLDQVPDRSRAEQALPAAGAVLFKLNLVELDPEAPGETHGPLDFAPAPGLAATLFDGATLEANLDHLARAQSDDGGWTFNWPAWSPATQADWRGCVTVEALLTLRAYGRL